MSPEVPLEKTQEDLMEHAHEAGERWVMGVALTAAVLAALAAITALLAEHHATEAMLEQIESADQWNFYQAKGIKAGQLESKVELLAAQGKNPDSKDVDKLQRYHEDQKEIMAEAKAAKKRSEAHLGQHWYFAVGLTIFQVSIAVAAISVLTKRRVFWYGCMVAGAAGFVFLVLGITAANVH